MATNRFPPALVEAVRDAQVIGVRAGSAPHRVIGVWAVVVEGRVFVRSWGRKPGGWNDTFRAVGHGVMEVAGRRRRVRAIATRSARLRQAVSDALAEKYHTPGSRRWVRDMSSAACRATTLELVPLPPRDA